MKSYGSGDITPDKVEEQVEPVKKTRSYDLGTKTEETPAEPIKKTRSYDLTKDEAPAKKGLFGRFGNKSTEKAAETVSEETPVEQVPTKDEKKVYTPPTKLEPEEPAEQERSETSALDELEDLKKANNNRTLMLGAIGGVIIVGCVIALIFSGKGNDAAVNNQNMNNSNATMNVEDAGAYFNQQMEAGEFYFTNIDCSGTLMLEVGDALALKCSSNNKRDGFIVKYEFSDAGTGQHFTSFVLNGGEDLSWVVSDYITTKFKTYTIAIRQTIYAASDSMMSSPLANHYCELDVQIRGTDEELEHYVQENAEVTVDETNNATDTEPQVDENGNIIPPENTTGSTSDSSVEPADGTTSANASDLSGAFVDNDGNGVLDVYEPSDDRQYVHYDEAGVALYLTYDEWNNIYNINSDSIDNSIVAIEDPDIVNYDD